ncbi:MAG: hypothetical protein OSB65_14055 [Roseibacillus sp.]|nr:hypothetical protein [Roseibacillus sp.]
MPHPSHPLLSPVPVVITILILVAVGFGISRVGRESEGAEKAKENGGNRIAKSIPRRSEPSHEAGGYRKSEGKTEEEKKGWRDIFLLNQNEMMVQVSVRAREELKTLRANFHTKYDSPEERQAFGRELSGISDPAERQRLLQERTQVMRKARAEADAAKGFEARAFEKRLIVLMQVQNLYRMGEHIAKSPPLKVKSLAFNNRLAEWVKTNEGMDDAAFHSSFSNLRNDLNSLRQRNSIQGAKPSRKPAPISPGAQ